MRYGIPFIDALWRIRTAVTLLRSYTTSAPSGHLLLKEKALEMIHDGPLARGNKGGTMEERNDGLLQLFAEAGEAAESEAPAEVFAGEEPAEVPEAAEGAAASEPELPQ